MTAIALTIAGSDSGGGAGIQADLKTFSALGVYGASVITALTAQNTRTVARVQPAGPAMIAAQIATVFDDLDIRAVKLGMLGDGPAIRAVAEGLAGRDLPIVLDPVMVAKSGDALLADDAIDGLRALLLPRATLLTPNLPEAARLTGTPPARSRDQMHGQALALMQMGAQAVLLKGGHGQGPQCHDLLMTPDDGPRWLSAPRHATRNTHGTGCTLSAAIAAELAKGWPLQDAVAAAHCYLQGAIAAADSLTVGQGHGPVHHFHAVWPHA
ncbi:bifunctional hydroxymethylpyrimidine kinase/phosphomethylpyrimidine kinase [Paracoccus sediminilitoris]|uniref:bifunctional hydroxymethylpyrimidine kinase/phosphomethylpyrimidine kinase n=1 Tax=Paracoccus sediminilitoris TaxID=2202419 RepID=UPI000DB92B84|nr:bifunctional hydroxymethylpyrimidine kinase/phosphomethylpyrimidine kinase [Paracoccus sediminilitoris]